MSRHQPAEMYSNRSRCSSRSKHREIARDAKDDVALHYLSFDTSAKFTSESSDRETTYEFLRGSPCRASPLHGTHHKSSQNTMNCGAGVRKDLHVKARGLRENAHNHATLAVDGFVFVEKMTCAWSPVTVTPQRRAFARLRVVL